jgi:uncharacterized protein
VAEKKIVPKVEGLFTGTDKPRLIGSKCTKCGTYSFPKSIYCVNPDCDKDTSHVEVVELSNKGKLYTFAVQTYSPPEPFKLEPFAPFPIGMVDIPEGLKILSMLTTDKVQIGMDVELVTKKLHEDENNIYVTWAWAPVEKGKKS